MKGGHFSAVTEPKQAAELLRAIDAYQGAFPVQCALKLAPLGLSAPANEWAHIGLEAAKWRYTVTKTDTAHIAQAAEILRALHPLTGHGHYVFPSARTPNGSRPLSDVALLAALRRMDFSKDEATVLLHRIPPFDLLTSDLDALALAIESSGLACPTVFIDTLLAILAGKEAEAPPRHGGRVSVTLRTPAGSPVTVHVRDEAHAEQLRLWNPASHRRHRPDRRKCVAATLRFAFPVVWSLAFEEPVGVDAEF